MLYKCARLKTCNKNLLTLLILIVFCLDVYKYLNNWVPVVAGSFTMIHRVLLAVLALQLIVGGFCAPIETLGEDVDEVPEARR